LINLERIRNHRLETDPYRWAAVHDLFTRADGLKLAATYPCDHFKLVAARGGEKDYEYEARQLIAMGANVLSYPGELSESWRALGNDLLSPEYRSAMSALTGCDLSQTQMEVNVFHYGPGGSLGAHRDLPEKLVTHVLYFNRTWNRANGGCLSILRSGDPADLVAEIPPLIGNSSVIVRSENSWHAVSQVVNHSACSRRSMTITFYPPGSVSSMWPPHDTTALHSFNAPDLMANREPAAVRCWSWLADRASSLRRLDRPSVPR
jgi:SM-20-related protein